MNQFNEAQANSSTPTASSASGPLTVAERAYYESVIVVNCGGTINMSGVQERKPAGAVEGEIAIIKEEMKRFDIKIEFVDVFDRPPDSSNMGETEWEIMFSHLAEVVEHKRRIAAKLAAANHPPLEKGGIVVTHGTDTLQISSFVMALKFSLHDTFLPIIFTGSYAPIHHKDGSDGASNLRNSLFVAKGRRLDGGDELPPGVYVLIGQDIHLASRLSKVYSRPNPEGKYFFSFPAPVGNVFVNKKDFKIKVNRDYLALIKGVEPLKEENVKEVRSWGNVEHIVIDYFTAPQVLEDFVGRARLYQATGKRVGLIIQGDFSRNERLPEFVRILQELAGLNVITLVGSRNTYERIVELTPVQNFSKIHKSLTHAKARVKLSWLLKFTLSAAEVLKLMDTNIIGDIFEITELPQWIKYETLPDIIPGTEVVMIYPNIHPQVMDDVIRRIAGSNERGRICLVGFGDGHIPAPNKSIAQITQDFVRSEGLLPKSDFTCCENVQGVLEYLSNLLKEIPGGTLKKYLLTHYSIEEVQLRSNLYKMMAKAENAQQRQALGEELARVLTNFSLQQGERLHLKNPGALIDLLEEKVKFTYEENLFRDKLQLMQQERTLLEIAAECYPELIACRIIRDALVESHPLLTCIGKAIDQGMQVEIKTSVARARTNTDLYEIGNMLKIIGVHSDEVAGWETGYLLRLEEN